MLPIGEPQLRQLAPSETGVRRTRQTEIIHDMGGAFAATLDAYGINTPLRIGHFMAQIAYESDGFCTTEEYASGRAYEGRADLGNVHAGDGPLFKGRGLIQLTGRVNYRATGAKLRLDLEGKPRSVNDPVIYLLVSCVFWEEKAVNHACDADDVIAVTRLVNGGVNGLIGRKSLPCRRPNDCRCGVGNACHATAGPGHHASGWQRGGGRNAAAGARDSGLPGRHGRRVRTCHGPRGQALPGRTWAPGRRDHGRGDLGCPATQVRRAACYRSPRHASGCTAYASPALTMRANPGKLMCIPVMSRSSFTARSSAARRV